MFSKLADGGHAISKIDFNFLLKKQFKVESFHKSDSRNTNVHLSVCLSLIKPLSLLETIGHHPHQPSCPSTIKTISCQVVISISNHTYQPSYLSFK